MKLYLRLQTFVRLGLVNIARVALYRLGLRTGFHPAVRLRADITGSNFFAPPEQINTSLPGSTAWGHEVLYFGWYKAPLLGKPPEWHTNPFTGKTVDSSGLYWWQLPDFSLNVGDIKTVWEASRFAWVLSFAQRVRKGDKNALLRLNAWLADWCQKNTPYRGVNWKCGQEASIRVMHLAMAAAMLGQKDKPCIDLMRLVEVHLSRIYPTVSYAMAQDNNHGTSEAVALFIGGRWCEALGIGKGHRWARTGRRLLENRAKRLIEQDGSFSQYSLNYHRLMLDTLCMAELWRRWQHFEPFSKLFYDRAKAAAHWLRAMVNPENGDGPNLGANDGAHLFPLTDSDYRDFRPSVQLAVALFAGRRAYSGDGSHNLPLAWLGVDLPDDHAATPGSEQFDDGGYALLRNERWMVLLRYPRYRFRPRHCDALHLDLWHGMENLLRDAGSYSYNTDEPWEAYFTGTVGHNTVQFDDRDQMPLLSRFLRGAWLQTRDVEPMRQQGDLVTVGAGYCDWKGAYHHRRVRLQSDGIYVQDQVNGFSTRAVLRWRLRPGKWELAGREVRCGVYLLRCEADVPIVRYQLVEGWESRYYMKKSPLPVLEVEIGIPGTFKTELKIC